MSFEKDMYSTVSDSFWDKNTIGSVLVFGTAFFLKKALNARFIKPSGLVFTGPGKRKKKGRRVYRRYIYRRKYGLFKRARYFN